MTDASSGWDAVERVPLAAPWDQQWVEVYLDPPMGIWIQMRRQLGEATSVAGLEAIDALVGSLHQLVAAHNIPGRDGGELVWDAAHMGSRLIRAIAEAVTKVMEGGAPASPPTSPASSPAGASRSSRSRRTTRSGGLPG